MKMNLELMIEHLQETGKVYFPEGSVKEAVEELGKMGYEVHFNPSTDCLVLDAIKNDEVGGNKMTRELKNLLEVVVSEENDLMQETIDAAKIILAGGYKGHDEDIEYLEDVRTGFELEKVLSQGKWYWQDELRMERLIEKAAILIDKEIEENLFIEDSPIIGPECRYLDNLAEDLATFEILGEDIYEREDKYEAYILHEDKILGLADELLERIETDIMKKYNCFQSHDIFYKFYYKVDEKFETLEECLDFFDISI
jgi:hypothetical protein